MEKKRIYWPRQRSAYFTTELGCTSAVFSISAPVSFWPWAAVSSSSSDYGETGPSTPPEEARADSRRNHWRNPCRGVVLNDGITTSEKTDLDPGRRRSKGGILSLLTSLIIRMRNVIWAAVLITWHILFIPGIVSTLDISDLFDIVCHVLSQCRIQ